MELDPARQAFIDAHRRWGHRCAALDPLGAAARADAALLAPQRFGLAAAAVVDLEPQLKAAYCGPLALDCSAVRDAERCDWLYARMEEAPPVAALQQADDAGLLERLARAQAWEHHVAECFPEAKRFSLEGCEALLPLLDALLAQAAALGIKRLCMAMPHRGRVNVLVNLLGLPPAQLLDYFDATSEQPQRHTDLVYHLGGERQLSTRHGPIVLQLAHNPSHLQSVQPVLAGITRAWQDRDGGPDATAPLLLHGDAAFAGQGVVMESLQLGLRPGYAVGGCVHVIINNQVGFTTPHPMDGQAQHYCTDVLRMIDAPVLRLNAEAPELAARAAQIAFDYRQRFRADIAIDLIGYRRLGHSEHDLPALSRPQVHGLGAQRPSVVELHAQALRRSGRLTPAQLDVRLAQARADARRAFTDPWLPPPEQHPSALPRAEAPVSLAQLQAHVATLSRLPPGFRPHPVIVGLLQRWQRQVRGRAERVDWCLAENMAYATVLAAGIGLRLSGMDVGRGTFVHRQAVWHDQTPGAAAAEGLVPLRQLARGSARVDIVNSPLSEEAVLGFEYGYSTQAARTLTIWEAQFGDFVNGAQVFLDQYLAAGEEKWGYRSALAVLLPHGHEGIGPDHSSAYLGRFLQLCGGGNLRVACPSTSAQCFHLLRRQALDVLRKPLVALTPKSTLYAEPGSHAALSELLDGEFRPVLDDADAPLPPDQVRRLLLCSGKLFYDLDCARRQQGRADVGLLRLEQFYPFPDDALGRLLARYSGLRELVWVQEEHQNQGAWQFVREALEALLRGAAPTPQVVARPVSASGATSSVAIHRREQAALVVRALGSPH